MTSTSELLLRWDQSRARSKQIHLGVSDLGGCRRYAGYRVAQTEPTNPGGSVQAAFGSAIHTVVAEQMSSVAEPGDLVEHPVEFAGIPGTVDRYEASTGTVQDTKTTSSRWLEHLKLHGPDQPHRFQVNVYGAALVKQGHVVKRVRIDYLARDTGEEWSWEAPFDPSVVREALLWLRNVRDTPLDMLPRDYMPDSAICHGCRFSGLCWPYGLEGRGPSKVLLAEKPADEWAEQLWLARRDAKDAKDREKRARTALEDMRPVTGMGLVDAGEHRLKFTASGQLRFVSKDSSGREPAMGYEEGDG